MISTLLHYDESLIARNLQALSLAGQVRFAAICSEFLIPSFEWVAERSGNYDIVLVRHALDLAWAVESSVLLPTAEVEDLASQVESYVQDADDEEWLLEGEVADNALAAVIYSLRAIHESSVQSAVWAGRQVYEAADWLAGRVARLDPAKNGDGRAIQTALDVISLALTSPTMSTRSSVHRSGRQLLSDIQRVV